jgi:hypothetical protein
MAPRLPRGFEDDFATPLTQDEATFVAQVMAWALSKNKRIDAQNWLDLPEVTGTKEEYDALLAKEPTLDSFLKTNAPDLTFYNAYYNKNEKTILDKVTNKKGLTSTEAAAVLANDIGNGKTIEEVIDLIVSRPDTFKTVKNSKFASFDDYADFASTLFDQAETSKVNFDDAKDAWQRDVDNFVYDPYKSVGVNVPSPTATYAPDASFPKVRTRSGEAVELRSTPSDDAIQLAVAKEIYKTYGPQMGFVAPDSVINAQAPSTTVPGTQMSGQPTGMPPSQPMTELDRRVAQQKAQVAREFGQLGLSGNYGLGAGPMSRVVTPSVASTPAALPGPSRPVVTSTKAAPAVDNRRKALMKILSAKQQGIL